MSKSLVPLSLVVVLFVALVAPVVVLCPRAARAQGEQAATYLHLSDVHLDTSGASDDTDLALWKITREKLESILNGPEPPSFVLYTGDLPGHYACAPGHGDCSLIPSQVPGHDANLRAVLQDLHDLVAGTGIPLLYTPGNNDALAGNYFSFSDAQGRTAFSLVPGDGFPAVNASQPCGDVPCMVSNPRPDLGFYSARPVAGLRVIALNSILLGRRYHPADGVSQRAAGDAELDWLDAQLADAARSGEKVLLAMHIPPGEDAYAVDRGDAETGMWTRDPEGNAAGLPEEAWLDRFLDLVGAHTSTVVGLAYGHTHEDELRRLHDKSGRVIEVAVSAPGITTNHGNHPGFKLVSYDARTKELVGFTTFFTEMGDSTWGDEYYTFSELYGCAGRSTILGCLTSPAYADTASIDRILRRYYSVMNGPPTYDPGPGIEVEYGQ